MGAGGPDRPLSVACSVSASGRVRTATTVYIAPVNFSCNEVWKGREEAGGSRGPTETRGRRRRRNQRRAGVSRADAGLQVGEAQRGATASASFPGGRARASAPRLLETPASRSSQTTALTRGPSSRIGVLDLRGGKGSQAAQADRAVFGRRGPAALGRHRVSDAGAAAPDPRARAQPGALTAAAGSGRGDRSRGPRGCRGGAVQGGSSFARAGTSTHAFSVSSRKIKLSREKHFHL